MGGGIGRRAGTKVGALVNLNQWSLQGDYTIYWVKDLRVFIWNIDKSLPHYLQLLI